MQKLFHRENLYDLERLFNQEELSDLRDLFDPEDPIDLEDLRDLELPGIRGDVDPPFSERRFRPNTSFCQVS